MDTPENKKMLWDFLLSIQGFKPGVTLERTQHVFETVLQKVNQESLELTDKNKKFIVDFTSLIKKELVDEEHVHEREHLFQERVSKNQERYKQHTPDRELDDIKKLLYAVLDKLERL